MSHLSLRSPPHAGGRYKLLLDDWRGYLIGFFALVFVANVYMNFFSQLRVDIHVGKTEAKANEQEIEKKGSA
jgi:hypothetical protein